jgi:predicted RecA/RadA family phage recombinase
MKNFYETGDNLQFVASQIVCPQHASGDTYTNLVGPGEGATTPINLVEDGDPCVIGRIVGVSNMDAVFSTDLIVVSTRGVYTLSVTSAFPRGIHVGETIYIDALLATLSDNQNSTNGGIPFGVAIQSVAAGATSTIQVKLFSQTPDSNGLQGGIGS